MCSKGVLKQPYTDTRNVNFQHQKKTPFKGEYGLKLFPFCIEQANPRING